MANLKEIIFRAEQLAVGHGIDPHDSPVIDAGLTAEALYPHALRFAIRKGIAEGKNSAQDFTVEHSVEIIGGSAAIPDAVLREYADHAYLPDEPYSSFVKFPDFQRNRFNNLLCYWSMNAGQLHYSCDVPKVVRAVAGFTNGGDENFASGVGTALTSADAGRRIRLEASGTLYIDSFINSVVDASSFTARGEALSTPLTALSGTIYESDKYTAQRSLTAINSTSGSATVTCANGAFTDADIGRRLTVTVSGVYIVDAFIAAINSPTSVDLTAAALGTTVVGIGDVSFASLSLAAPSVPADPATADTDIDISPNLVEDVIAVIAAALTGEMKLERLIKTENFDTR